MYLVKTPPLIKSLFPDYLWQMPGSEKAVFLTFDDGPIPEVTPWILDLLAEVNFKATFFCVGDNVRRHPAIYQRLLQEGHAVGNHTFHHCNGWQTDTADYVKDVHLCDEWVDSDLFRPPYGKLKPAQASILKKEKTIVLWDVLSGDFDERISADQCLDNVKKNVEAGSIIVFHDNIKSEEKLRIVLPAFLAHLIDEGYTSLALAPVAESIC